jgi:tRNA threonylcarbamoyladenosine biosynthesis protein TsaE
MNSILKRARVKKMKTKLFDHLKSIKSRSPEDTFRIAEEFAANAAPGDIIALTGELGAGKTVFAQGFARGVGYEGRVTSPTFTLMNIYEGGRLTLYHFDLYRLTDGGEGLEGIGYEDFFYAGGVCLIEWAERAGELLPENAVEIRIERVDDARVISIK